MDSTGGRRGNGLFSADWGALVDLDPRLSSGLLDALGAAGVPAYVEPAASVDTVHRAVTMPPRPMDRLWVDPARAEAARTVVSAEVADLTALLAEDERPAAEREAAYGMVAPVPQGSARRVLPPPRLPSLQRPAPSGPGERTLSDDELFAQIIADFDTPAQDRVPRWPAAEDAGPLAPPGAAPRPPVPPKAAPPQPLPAWLEPDPVREEGTDDHFVPPPPPPVPRVRARTVLAFITLTLGLLVIFAPGLVQLPDTNQVKVLGMALLGGGFAMLVYWLREAGPQDDDGAVV